MLLTADWVLPVDAGPIRRGGVVVHNTRIAAVGPAEEVAGLERHSRLDFPGCVITPGLVNAHTHLSLTALQGLLPPGPFPDWLRRIVPMMQALDADDLAASAALGALRCLQAGATVVGDIAYGPESPAAAGDVGVAGTFFWEVLGVGGAELPAALAEAEFPEPARAENERMRAGISPHTPYTSGPSLLRAEARFARENGYPFAIHVAESSAEIELFAQGSGPLRDLSRRLALDLGTEHRSPVAYLDSIGVLEGALAVHCVHLLPGEAHALAHRTRGVVLCPRSNRYLRNGTPPVDALVGAGAVVCVGSDSLASNEGVDLFAEARELREVAPKLDAARLLRMLTLDGATALGLDESFGSITPGKQADLAVFKVASGEPEAALIERGGRDTTEAVLTAGIWRVREGRPTFPVKPLEADVARAADKARAALER